MEHENGSYELLWSLAQGTAGCVLARGCSEDRAASHVLLRRMAGAPLERCPTAAGLADATGTSADWADTTVVPNATGAAMTCARAGRWRSRPSTA